MRATLAEPLKRDGFGEYKLLPDSLDDLWHLSHLIGEGSLPSGCQRCNADDFGNTWPHILKSTAGFT